MKTYNIELSYEQMLLIRDSMNRARQLPDAHETRSLSDSLIEEMMDKLDSELEQLIATS